jgi:uncharacterized membrane protein
MTPANSNARLEAFCDGVFAIALTLLIIDVKLPADGTIGSNGDLWRALGRLTPTVAAFLLSFVIILITWVNHHATLKRIHSSTPAFIYANGFLLLTVVFIPFPTALLGEFVGTDHAAPAVILYNTAIAVQSIAWILISRLALRNGLTHGEEAAVTMHENIRNGYVAFAFYSLLAVVAFWFPLAVAIVTTASWLFWLALGFMAKRA